MNLSIRGTQQAQLRNQRMIAALKPDGRINQALQLAATDLQRYAISITHVDTGTLRAAHRIQMFSGRAEIYVSPAAVNPRSRVPATEYASVEEARGGAHAFYSRTQNERGDRALALAIAHIAKGVMEQ